MLHQAGATSVVQNHSSFKTEQEETVAKDELHRLTQPQTVIAPKMSHFPEGTWTSLLPTTFVGFQGFVPGTRPGLARRSAQEGQNEALGNAIKPELTSGWEFTTMSTERVWMTIPLRAGRRSTKNSKSPIRRLPENACRMYRWHPNARVGVRPLVCSPPDTIGSACSPNDGGHGRQLPFSSEYRDPGNPRPHSCKASVMLHGHPIP